MSWCITLKLYCLSFSSHYILYLLLQDISEELMGGEGFPMHMTSPSDATSSEPPASSWSNLGSDKQNVLVLIFLYVLQGKCGNVASV